MSIRPVLLYRQTMADKRMTGAREAWRPDPPAEGGSGRGRDESSLGRYRASQILSIHAFRLSRSTFPNSAGLAEQHRRRYLCYKCEKSVRVARLP